jgi:putative DNA primase/helicase
LSDSAKNNDQFCANYSRLDDERSRSFLTEKGQKDSEKHGGVSLTQAAIPSLVDHNAWADFWRYQIGVNVIPAFGAEKTPLVKWKEYQDKPISEALHNQWKSENKFRNGMAVIAGRCWFKTDAHNRTLYLNLIYADNSLTVQELCTRPDETLMSIEDLGNWTLVEQHLDDRTRLHVYVYSYKPFPQKTRNESNALQLEIKGSGQDGIHYCTPSIHKNGHHYQIVGKDEPVIADEFLNHLIKINKKYGIEYPESLGQQQHQQSYASRLWKEDAAIYKGHNRHGAILSLMDSLLIKFPNESEEFLFDMAERKNQTMCKDENENPAPLSDKEMRSLWKQAKGFASDKVKDNQESAKQGQEDKIVKYAERIMQESVFKTCTDNSELYYYNGKVYVSGQEWRIKQTAQLIDSTLRNYEKQEIINWIKDATYVDRAEFDSNPNIITVDNGLLNLHTRQLQPFTSEHISLIKLPMKYDPNATCPNIVKFLNEVLTLKDEVDMIIKLIGNCLLTSCEYETAVMLYGGGRNGKGTLLKLVEAFLGKGNYSNRSLQDLDRNKFAIADLFGKLANIFADLKSLRLQETGYFKMIVSGDSLSGEKKFKDAFGFRNRAKLWFSANEIPESDDKSDAFYRRWKIFHFDKEYDRINRDTNLINKLTTSDELSGLLNLALGGLAKLIEEGGFDQDIEAIRKDYEIHTNDVNAFLDDECVTDITNETFSTLATDLYAAYVTFCKKRGTRPKEMNAFGRKLADKGIYNMRHQDDKSRDHYYDGVKLIVPMKDRVNMKDIGQETL